MTRIIAGVAGSLRLNVPQAGTRPTSDRVREAIFSALESWGCTDGTRVLDLYAGSGALGLEAASRGATAVTLVEHHAAAARIVQQNTRTVLSAFANRGATPPTITVERSTVQRFLETQSPALPWDVVCIDPPYDLPEAELQQALLTLRPCLAPDAVVLVERSSRSPEPQWNEAYALIRSKHYGETTLWWAEPREGTTADSAA